LLATFDERYKNSSWRAKAKQAKDSWCTLRLKRKTKSAALPHYA